MSVGIIYYGRKKFSTWRHIKVLLLGAATCSIYVCKLQLQYVPIIEHDSENRYFPSPEIKKSLLAVNINRCEI